MPLFEPPTMTIPFTGLLYRWRTTRGVTVWKQNGVWYQQQNPFWGNKDTSGVKDADIVVAADRPGGECTDGTDRDRYLFLGGHVYEVSNAVALELVNADFTVGATPGGEGLTIDELEGSVDQLIGTVDEQ